MTPREEAIEHYKKELERYRAELNDPQATPEYKETIYRLMAICQGLIDNLQRQSSSNTC